MISQWNIIQKVETHPEDRGWFFGHFVPEWDFFHSKDAELKYQSYKKWEKYIGSETRMPRKTIGILISGRICVRFPSLHMEFLLEKPFDYIADDEIPWDHEVEILEDSIVLAFRTPSRKL